MDCLSYLLLKTVADVQVIAWSSDSGREWGQCTHAFSPSLLFWCFCGTAECNRLIFLCERPWPQTPKSCYRGLILFSMLLNIYMKLLGEVIRRGRLWSHQDHAYDTHLYCLFWSNSKGTTDVVNQCLVPIIGWMNMNKLDLNEVVWLGRKTD